jgi:DNA replication and repair protein RecF
MGKTNLLDAIYYLCMCKNYAGVNDRKLVFHENDFFRLEGTFYLKKKKEKIVAKVIPGKKKVIENNDVPYKKIMEHIGSFPVVMIVPDDTLLVTEGSEIRRRFLDNTLSQLEPLYLSNLMIYNKVLKQRNAALKQFAMERIYDEKLIGSYNQQLLKPAELIYKKRDSFSKEFTPLFEKYYHIISGEQETVKCEYFSQLENENLKTLLKQYAKKDSILQRTTCGIHRDDLKFFLGGHSLKNFASQGQLKSYVLALKLAQYEMLRIRKEVAPLLLLDDIFDKLDQFRVKHLISLLIEKKFGQIFITDTHENRVQDIIEKFDTDFKKFVIDSGTATL